MEQNLPKDPVMLLSFVNTQLRDNYSSLEDFCRFFDLSEEKLVDKLEKIQYKYDAKQNQFI